MFFLFLLHFHGSLTVFCLQRWLLILSRSIHSISALDYDTARNVGLFYENPHVTSRKHFRPKSYLNMALNCLLILESYFKGWGGGLVFFKISLNGIGVTMPKSKHNSCGMISQQGTACIQTKQFAQSVSQLEMAKMCPCGLRFF